VLIALPNSDRTNRAQGISLHIFLALDRAAAPQVTARCLKRRHDARCDADENSCVENYAKRDARHIHAVGDVKSC
jgi:hypothetical protein